MAREEPPAVLSSRSWRDSGVVIEILKIQTSPALSEMDRRISTYRIHTGLLSRMRAKFRLTFFIFSISI